MKHFASSSNDSADHGRIPALAALALLVASASQAAPTATFMGLGVPPGLDQAWANAVSADGAVVVGAAEVEPDPFHESHREAWRWTLQGGFELLGNLAGSSSVFNEARGVSGDGSIVVGHSGSNLGSAFRWTAATGMEALPGPTGTFSDALAISSDGSTIAGSIGSSGFAEAVIWKATGFARLTGGGATDVSGDGSIVVGPASFTTGTQAFRWTAASGIVRLGDLPGGITESHASAVSADGSVIVGESSSAAGFEAFRWTGATGMNGLGDLPGGDFGSAARGVSRDGLVVVGEASSADGLEAFVWDPDRGMRNLRDVLMNEFGLDLTAWRLRSANGVSEDGRTIVGEGFNGGRFEPWIATLTSECSDGVDNDGDGRIDLDDPGCTSASDPSEHDARFACDDGIDNDGDGLVDFADPVCQRSWPYWESAPPASAFQPPPTCGVGAELALAMPILGWLRRRVRLTPTAPSRDP